MKEPWQHYLQVGVVHPMLFPECLGGHGPVFGTLRDIAHDPFFEAVDVTAVHDAGEREACAALARDSRLTVTFACQPVQLRQGVDLNSADAARRAHAVETVCGCLEQARQLGAVRFAIMSGVNVPADDRRAALGRLIESVRLVCREARERAGLPVVLEIFDHDMDKKALIGTCELAAHVAREVRRDFPGFGLMHDLSHIYLCHEDPARHLPLIRDDLVAVHAGNSVSRRGHAQFGDTHPLFGVAGGDSDVPQLANFLKVLFDIGYLRRGPRSARPGLAFEIRTPPGAAPQTVIAHIKRTFQRAWWELGK